MKRKCLKAISVSVLLSSIAFSSVACSCGGKYKITFVTEGNSDIVRYVKKGETLEDIPTPPDVKGKYCTWNVRNFKNIQEDMEVTANCYSKVAKMETNMPSEINVDVFSDEASLDYIFKDMEIEVTFESGVKQKIYSGEYMLDAGTYNKDVSGSYNVKVIYNDAKQDIKINVNKIDNYVTVSLNGGVGYYNEGLPQLIANTDVEGKLAFDQGQELLVGTKSYTWTFTPVDTNKYNVLHGSIKVKLITADEITLNKQSIDVEFGTSKSEIIERIKDGLIVEGKFENNSFKEIDEAFYTVDSSDFVVNKSGTFTFFVKYDSTIYKSIEVNVGKCDTYDLEVNDIDEYITKKGDTLDSLTDSLVVNSGIGGTIAFKQGQELINGEFYYDYVFTPADAHYAIREGKVKIKTYTASNLHFTNIKDIFSGDKTRFEIIAEMKASIVGKVIYNYNEDISKVIDTNLITITIEHQEEFSPGVYEYEISYNNEISMMKTFVVE